jgi:hypothetical protein
MQQIYEGLEANGILIGEMVKTNRGLMWNVTLACGHKQEVRHSDLAAKHQPVCATCLKAVELKASGIETTEQFNDWHARRAIRLPHALPTMEEL